VDFVHEPTEGNVTSAGSRRWFIYSRNPLTLTQNESKICLALLFMVEVVVVVITAITVAEINK
jgi:hypothetical protein